MKRACYYILLPFVCLLGLPFMVFCRDKWNAFGRKFDACFGVESRHTKNYNKNNNNG